MSTTYNGDGTVPLPVAANVQNQIDSSTATTPIQVVFVFEHGFNPGDTIVIEGHDNLPANGLFQCTVLNATTISLNNSGSSTTGGETGYAVDYSVTPQITLPSDGDKITASSVNPAFEESANIVPFLYKNAGAFKVLNVYSNYAAEVSPFTSYKSPYVTTGVGFSNFTGMTSLLAGGFASPLVPVMEQGDQLIISFETAVNVTIASSDGTFSIVLCNNIAGAGLAFQKPDWVNGFVDSTVGSTHLSVSISTVYVQSGATPANGVTFDFGLQVWTQFSTSTSFQIQGGFGIVVTHLRPTGNNF